MKTIKFWQLTKQKQHIPFSENQSSNLNLLLISQIYKTYLAGQYMCYVYNLNLPLSLEAA